ncbi:hypothetical protein EYF80_001381 [Liparis tanakae]|uniref:Uncharacterized protein n=1 Tax=Liparis tanakae TaxID=230148 RepID=A0A4Z2JG42_9TELE|nr:hypothetical protein EYF80_001381 [Liparis tanakae]
MVKPTLVMSGKGGSAAHKALASCWHLCPRRATLKRHGEACQRGPGNAALIYTSLLSLYCCV